MTTILDRWGLTIDELTKIVDGNPSLRGFLIGYTGEFQLQKMWFSDPRISRVMKPDDHERGKKNDLTVVYEGYEFTIEVKSLQTNSIKRDGEIYKGDFQCDASDRRPIKLPNGQRIETTCLLIGGFDIVAVNLFAFREKWEFAFALNRDLPRSTSKKYTAKQQKYLLATSVKVGLPLQQPFVPDPFILLDQLVSEKKKRQRALTKTKK